MTILTIKGHDSLLVSGKMNSDSLNIIFIHGDCGVDGACGGGGGDCGDCGDGGGGDGGGGGGDRRTGA